MLSRISVIPQRLVFALAYISSIKARYRSSFSTTLDFEGVGHGSIGCGKFFGLQAAHVSFFEPLKILVELVDDAFIERPHPGGCTSACREAKSTWLARAQSSSMGNRRDQHTAGKIFVCRRNHRGPDQRIMFQRIFNRLRRDKLPPEVLIKSFLRSVTENTLVVHMADVARLEPSIHNAAASPRDDSNIPGTPTARAPGSRHLPHIRTSMLGSGLPTVPSLCTSVCSPRSPATFPSARSPRGCEFRYRHTTPPICAPSGAPPEINSSASPPMPARTLEYTASDSRAFKCNAVGRIPARISSRCARPTESAQR